MFRGEPLRVIGYVRVSTAKQDVGPDVQIAALQRAAAERNWDLDIRREDAASAASLHGRPVLAEALADLRDGRADVLAVSKLDRLVRSVADGARLLEDADREDWLVAFLDLDVDTSSLAGRGMAHVLMTFAEMERRRISERTRDAMAVLRDEGRHLGRPSLLDPQVRARIRGLHTRGWTQQAIADRLNRDGVPTPSGAGRWHSGSIARILAV